MNIDDWRARWESGQTGFHEASANALLVEHARVFDGRRRVLVPLCGKALDLAFLRGRGLDVVGVEGVEQAARGFFSDAGVAPEERVDGATRWLSSGGGAIGVADFFTVELARCDAAYDRGALVAIDPALRGRYVEKVRSLLEPSATILIVSFGYDQAQMAGPPFSLDEADVHALFDAHGVVSRLATRDALADNPRFRERGATSIVESVFRVELSA